MEHLLSNIEVILLSIVNAKPSYAYEIDKTIDLREMKRWVRVGVASIYRVLIKLEEKGLVNSHNEKEGRMPERKRYYITDSGRASLAESSKRLLSDLEWYYLDLSVGFETSDSLTHEDVDRCLKKRLAKVKANKKILKEIYLTNEVVDKKGIIVKNLIHLREAEEKFLKEVIQELSINE